MGSDELSGRSGPVQKSRQPRNERAETLTNRAQSLLMSSIYVTYPSWLNFQRRYGLILNKDYTLAQNEQPKPSPSTRPKPSSEYRPEDFNNERVCLTNLGILEYRHLVADLLIQQMARNREISYTQLPIETREMVNKQVSPIILPTDEEIQTMIDAACQYGYRDPQIDNRPDRLTTYENPERNRLRAISHIRKVCISGNFTSFQELLDYYTNRLAGIAIAIKNNDGQAILHQLASVAGVLRLLDVGVVSDEIIKQWQIDNARVLDGQEKLRQQITTAAPLQTPPQSKTPTTSPAPEPVKSLYVSPTPKAKPTDVPAVPSTMAPAAKPISAKAISTIPLPVPRGESTTSRFIYNPKQPLLEQITPQILKAGQVEIMGDQQVVSTILGDFLGANGIIRVDIDPNTIRINGQGIKITRKSVTVTIDVRGQLENQGGNDLRFRSLQIDITDAPKIFMGQAAKQAAQDQANYTDSKFSLVDTLVKSYNDRLAKLRSRVEITGLTLNIENGQLHVVIQGKRKQ